MDETSDGELLRQIAAGSQSGMRALVEKHSRTLIRYAWALVESPSDVDDVVQDTFLTAWRGADRIALSGESALPWLLVTCRNHAANLARSRSRKRTYPITDEPVWNDQQDARDRLRWVLDEIERLPALDRRVCELCLVQDRPYDEVARELGLSVDSVRQRVSRSRRRLRKAVSHEE